MIYTVQSVFKRLKEEGNKLTENFLLFALSGYLLLIYLVHTTYRIKISNRTFAVLIGMLTIAAIVRGIVNYASNNIKRKDIIRILNATVVSVVYIIIFYVHYVETKEFADYSFLLAAAVFSIGSIGIEYHKVIKVTVYTGVISIATAIIASWVGIIPNFVYMKDWHMRSSWGMGYPTDFAACFVFLTIFAWIGFKEIKGTLFFFPGMISLVIGVSVARSYSSSICSIGIIAGIGIEWLITNYKVTKIKKVIDKYISLSFPAFFIVTIGLMRAYQKGYGFAIRINDVLSGRLALESKAFEEYGLSLFGKVLPQIGFGGQSYGVHDYSFIDSAYCIILLRYGIAALIVITILWILISKKAIQIGDYRLALGMFLIAFNAIAEQRFMEIENNVLLLIPFAVLFADGYKRSQHKGEHNKVIYRPIIAIGSLLVLCLLVPKAIAFLRTTVTIKGFANADNQFHMAIVCFVITGTVLIATYYLMQMIETLLDKRRVYRCQAIIVSAVLFGVFAGLLWCNSIINDYIDKSRQKHIETAKLIKELQDVDDCDFFACRMPEVYNRMCGGIKSSIWNDAELAKFDNAVVLTDSDEDYYQFFKFGYTYTELPGGEALYTNNPAIIKYLDKNDYKVSGYYSKMGTVDMQTYANLTGFLLQDDGSIELYEGQQLVGPYIGLRAGPYTVTFDIEADRRTLRHKDGQDEVCSLQVTTFGGQIEAGSRIVMAEDFNSKRKCKAEVRFYINDSPDVEFRFLATDVSAVRISSVSYKKTPKYDIRFTLDKRHRRNYEEYYDLEGNKVDLDAGYAAKRLGYDGDGNINHEIYYDKYHRKKLNKSGFCEIKRVYNNNKQIIREEYYDVKGEPCLRSEGYAITTMEYNENGDIIHQKYYDTKGNEINV